EEQSGALDLAAVESCRASEPAEETRPRLAARILLAEDGRDNQRLIRTILTRAGADVTITDNGRDAVELALHGDFDLVLMDMQMPQLDGYGATSDDRDKCLRAGCDDYLTEPVEKDDLLLTLAAHIAGEPPRRKGTRTETPPRSGEQPIVSVYADDPDMIEAIVEFIDGLPAQVAAIQT